MAASRKRKPVRFAPPGIASAPQVATTWGASPVHVLGPLTFRLPSAASHPSASLCPRTPSACASCPGTLL
eukprot:9228411-Alexandrium_andersonii.AAC.1